VLSWHKSPDVAQGIASAGAAVGPSCVICWMTSAVWVSASCLDLARISQSSMILARSCQAGGGPCKDQPVIYDQDFKASLPERCQCHLNKLGEFGRSLGVSKWEVEVGISCGLEEWGKQTKKTRG
ncbi:hypothetical protein ABVT39_008321, partial [Epinephelus coioides]